MSAVGGALRARSAPRLGVAERVGPYRGDIIGALCAMAGASIVATLVLHLWNMDPRVALGTGSDGTLNIALVKGVLEHGWFLSNPDLGAPFGMHLQDFAAFNGDLTQFLVVKVLGLFFANPAAVSNADFLLTFPLVALAAYAMLRRLGVGYAVSAAVAIVFSVLPYHWNGVGRLFLIAYWGVPVACYLAIAVMTGEPLFTRRPGATGVRAVLTGRTLVTVLLIVIAGASDSYYASFAIGITILATIAAAVARRSRATLVKGVVVTGALLVVLAATQLPTIVYRSQHGTDVAVGQRKPVETQYGGLSLTDLVLPIPSHRIKAFADVSSQYDATSAAPVYEHTQQLGILGSLGLVWLAFALAAGVLAPGRWRFLEDRRHAAAALGASIAFLIGTVGGIGTLFAYVVTPQLRSQGRISVFVAFFALIGVALVLERLGRRLGTTQRRRAGLAAGLVAIVVLAALDQTSPSMKPDYKAVAADYHSDAAFVHQIEHTVPPGSSIFQLPYMPFPENGPIYRMEDYDGLRGYLHSTHLRWSYGATRGRLTDWAATASNYPIPTMLRAISAAGFDGVWVDTAGYADRLSTPLPKLSAALHEAPMMSANGRMAFFPMTAFNQALRAQLSPQRLQTLRLGTLYPVLPIFGAGFYGPEEFAGHPGHWACGQASLDIFNPAPVSRRVRLTGNVKSPAGTAHVRIIGPAGERQNVVTSPAGATVNLRLTLHPGHNVVRMWDDAPPAATGADTRDLRIEVLDVGLHYPGL